MSAPSAAVIFGIRILFDETLPNFEDLEWGVHPWLKRAKDADLEYRWDRIADAETNSHALFIGAILAHVGPEHATAAAFFLDPFSEQCKQAADKLANSGLTKDFGLPAVWVQWYEDL